LAPASPTRTLSYKRLVGEIVRVGQADGRSAVACGLAMQSAMSPFANLTTPAGTTIPLAIKVAIATGPARRFVVGDPDIQLLDVLVGDTLDKMAKVEKLADKGEILLYHDTAETLSAAGHVTLGAWRGEHTAALLGELLTPPTPNPWPAFEETLLPAEQSVGRGSSPRFTAACKPCKTFCPRCAPSLFFFAI
jgi:hypothetical protein